MEKVEHEAAGEEEVKADNHGQYDHCALSSVLAQRRPDLQQRSISDSVQLAFLGPLNYHQ